MINQEDIDLIRSEMIAEAKIDQDIEQSMYNLDNALDVYADRINEAYDILNDVSKDLSKYSHELSVYEILDSV